ncbi:MAG: hypothetical protein EF813_07760 [Methanosarcinales archaeon]|nr:MAG: hypothetical protein EF813_07760 [Methanosarcinales archaeon]
MSRVSVVFVFVLLLTSVDVVQAISAAAGPGVMIVDTHVTQDFQGVDEYELVVYNTDIIPLRVYFTLEGDINNTYIMDVEFGDNDFILQPNKRRTIPVAFSAKVAGTYHGKIRSLFSGVQESGERTGADVGFAAATKVTINVHGERPEGCVTGVLVGDIGIDELLLITAEFENTGGVVASPRFSVMIRKNGEMVDTVSAPGTAILPRDVGVLNVTWDSTGQGTGNYTAILEVKLGDDVVYDDNHNFSVVLQLGSESLQSATHAAIVRTPHDESEKAPLTIYPLLMGFASAVLLIFRKQSVRGGGK